MDLPTQLKVNGRIFSVKYIKAFKTTSSVRIKKNRIVMRLSRFAMGRQRDEMIRKFLKWAEKKLSKISQSDFILPDYKNNGRICTHNKVYELRTSKGSRTTLKANVIEVPKDRDVRFLAEKTIMKDQQEYLRDVIDELNQLYFQEEYGHLRFKRMQSRFGSCSAKRNINIAYRLLFAPREIFRYVCLHELAHLKEMNHSKRFWSLVENAMPEYKKYEKWLRENGFMLG